MFPSVLNFARLVSRSRELLNRRYIEESFTLLMVALESLAVSEGEAIADSLSQRVGALLAISENIPFGDAVKAVHKLYDNRSRFVHQGDVISRESLNRLQDICRTSFFFACRSQSRCEAADRGRWQQKWFSQLDYIAAAFEAGVVVDSAVVHSVGGLMSTINEVSN